MSTEIGSEVVLYETTDTGVATITLNRPDRLNAWTQQMSAGFFEALERASGDQAVRAIVVTGAGRGFCAGADMDLLQSVGGGDAVVGEVTWVPTRMLDVPKPIIAAINGACAGYGLVVALMCDIRFAATGAKFTSSFVRRGLIAEYGSSWLLPRLIGVAGALDVLLSGRVFLAEEAERMGLVNRALPADGVLREASRYAQDLAANCSPASMAVIKRQVYSHLNVSLKHALEESMRLMDESLRGDDFREGVASYLEQRPPSFRPPESRAQT
jgi:enoyl-CoA hydratase/carnithine racemase